MTRLRKMMLEEIQRRNYSEITTRKYLQYVTAFAHHFGKSPDQLGPNEPRSYQAYLLRERKVTPGAAATCLAALRFFFIKTLKRHQFREFLPYPCTGFSRKRPSSYGRKHRKYRMYNEHFWLLWHLRGLRPRTRKAGTNALSNWNEQADRTEQDVGYD